MEELNRNKMALDTICSSPEPLVSYSKIGSRLFGHAVVTLVKIIQDLNFPTDRING